jgi:hypothetical protein
MIEHLPISAAPVNPVNRFDLPFTTLLACDGASLSFAATFKYPSSGHAASGASRHD